MYVPTMIFGHLLTSSNFNDEEAKVTGGRNGFGAKLCNVFSKKFTVETACKESRKEFKQMWKENMSKAGEPRVKDYSGHDFTRISYNPDLDKFKMESLDKVRRYQAFSRLLEFEASCYVVIIDTSHLRI